jgi:hypothetical protein
MDSGTIPYEGMELLPCKTRDILQIEKIGKTTKETRTNG